MTKKLIKNFMGTMVALPLIGATATMTNALPAGTARDITGTAVGLQSVALVGHTMKVVPGMGKKLKSKKMKW